MIEPLAAGDAREYEARLVGLGLEGGTLRQALGASNTERSLCSKEHAAKIAPGIYAYNGLVTSLSRQMDGVNDWRRIDLAGVLPIMLNDRTRVALGVTSGNQMTGRRSGKLQPSSRYPKGELTKKLVGRNDPLGQIALLERSAFQVEEEPDELAGYNLWLMLVYFDQELKEIRHEVSLPERLNAKGYVKDWYDRILPMEPYSVDGEEFGGSGNDPNDGFGPPSDVPVEKRKP
ncbi:hypothetical protein [Streptomyces sp. NBC_01190]|uniref:hypothetical protein n=1 Tax=Streptomyces sp. NBC_01190 TaxID=2903767 RepID=UPI00386A6CCC|nr:hypothetical protein OG519_16040 [Streptomyces sp. NBC_01190]